MGIPDKITLTGKVHIKYLDLIDRAKIGDLLLLLNDDATNPCYGEYNVTNLTGYIKTKIFDGLFWQNIDIKEFCLHREYKLIKKQQAIDSFLLCKEILMNSRNQIVYRIYRNHYTLRLYVPNIYIR